MGWLGNRRIAKRKALCTLLDENIKEWVSSHLSDDGAIHFYFYFYAPIPDDDSRWGHSDEEIEQSKAFCQSVDRDVESGKIPRYLIDYNFLFWQITYFYENVGRFANVITRNKKP
jgi:hypothetical protein